MTLFLWTFFQIIIYFIKQFCCEALFQSRLFFEIDIQLQCSHILMLRTCETCISTVEVRFVQSTTTGSAAARLQIQMFFFRKEICIEHQNILQSSVSLSSFILCCSHARVVGKTLVHEFPISYSNTEWYFIFSLFGARETAHAQRTLL